MGINMENTMIKSLLLGAAASALVASAATAADITVVSWGGAYTKSQVEAYHKPWQAKTGTGSKNER